MEKFADNIAEKNYMARIFALGLNVSDIFEWGGFLLKVGSEKLLEFEETKEEWEISKWATLDKLEERGSFKIILFPYHPKNDDVIFFLDGSFKHHLVQVKYYDNESLILRLLNEKNLLFSTQAGAIWGKCIYKSMFEQRGVEDVKS